ncbi:MAG: hypothetical protein SNJ77_08525 [Cytophagales bacterium]
MKKLLLKFFPFFFIPFLFSCEELREEITITNDGSGNYEVYTDMLPMMKTMASMGLNEELSEDEKKAKLNEMIWKGKTGKIDSIIDMKDKIGKEYKGKEYENILKNTTAYMKGGVEEDKMVMGVKFNFKNGKELESFQAMLEDSQKNKGDTKAMGKTKSVTKLSTSGFSRTTKVVEKVDLNDANMTMTMQFIANTKMVTVVKTPKKIKSVKGQFVKEQKDFEVVFEYNLASLLKQEINTDFAIEY